MKLLWEASQKSVVRSQLWTVGSPLVYKLNTHTTAVVSEARLSSWLMGCNDQLCYVRTYVNSLIPFFFVVYTVRLHMDFVTLVLLFHWLTLMKLKRSSHKIFTKRFLNIKTSVIWWYLYEVIYSRFVYRKKVLIFLLPLITTKPIFSLYTLLLALRN